MVQARRATLKSPTNSPQAPRGKAVRPVLRADTRGPARARTLASGAERASTRGEGGVLDLDHGITVYPARAEGGRWRAVWQEDGKRQQCEAKSEDKLAAKLDKVIERLAADAPRMKRPGADLIAHYLDPDRLPAEKRWSRKHAHAQRRLCERLAAPIIGTVACQDIKAEHMQKVVNGVMNEALCGVLQTFGYSLQSFGLSGAWLVMDIPAAMSRGGQVRAADRLIRTLRARPQAVALTNAQ